MTQIDHVLVAGKFAGHEHILLREPLLILWWRENGPVGTSEGLNLWLRCMYSPVVPLDAHPLLYVPLERGGQPPAVIRLPTK